MSTKTFTPIRGKRMRVTEIDECGKVLATSKSIVTNGFITVTLSAEVEDGTEITQKLADGSIRVNEKGNPSFKNFGVEIELSGVNPSLISMMTNAEEYTANADVAGFTVPEGEIFPPSAWVTVIE